MNIIPYSSFSNVTTYPMQQQIAPLPGQAQGVYITLHPEHREATLNKIIGWFAGREEIDLVGSDESEKAGLGFILLEWHECQIDQLFLALLRDEEIIADYSVYIRDLEG